LQRLLLKEKEEDEGEEKTNSSFEGTLFMDVELHKRQELSTFEHIQSLA